MSLYIQRAVLAALRGAGDGSCHFFSTLQHKALERDNETAPESKTRSNEHDNANASFIFKTA